MRRSTAWVVFALCSAAFGVLFLLPLGVVLSGGFFVQGRFTLRYLAGVLQNPIYAEGLWNSFKIAVGTTTVAMLIAVPLAWLANRYEFAGKKLFSGLVLVPMILPPFVGAIGFQQMFGQYGAVNALFGLGPVDWLGRSRYFGVVALQAFGLYPILYLNVLAALANIDPAMEEAAENLGCRWARKFWRITLPLMMPGLFAGATLVFIWSFTELGTPLIMNYTRCAPVQVFDALKEINTNPFPYALVTVMLAMSCLLYAAGKVALGGKAYAMQSKAATAGGPVTARGWRGWLVLLPFVVVTGVALLPHAGVLLTSVSEPGSWYQSVLPQRVTWENYREALGHGMTVGSIRNSLLYSALAVMVNIALGVTIAFVVVRSDLRARGVLDTLAMLPLAVPGLVMAFGYLAISSYLGNLAWVKDNRFWQHVLDVRTNPTLFLVIAYAVRRLPYMVRSAVAGLQQTSVALEESAANLGARPWTTVRRITLPLIAANLVAGILLAFSFSMLEVSDSLMLAQRADYFPITKTIYELFQLIGTGKYLAAALGVWAMIFLAVTILGASLLLGKKMGQLFRVG